MTGDVPSQRERVLAAQVKLLREAHEVANGVLRSAAAVAERDGRDVNWPDLREALRHSLDMSFAAMAALREADQ